MAQYATPEPAGGRGALRRPGLAAVGTAWGLAGFTTHHWPQVSLMLPVA